MNLSEFCHLYRDIKFLLPLRSRVDSPRAKSTFPTQAVLREATLNSQHISPVSRFTFTFTPVGNGYYTFSSRCEGTFGLWLLTEQSQVVLSLPKLSSFLAKVIQLSKISQGKLSLLVHFQDNLKDQLIISMTCHGLTDLD